MTSSKNDTLLSEVDIVEENLVEFQTRLVLKLAFMQLTCCLRAGTAVVQAFPRRTAFVQEFPSFG